MIPCARGGGRASLPDMKVQIFALLSFVASALQGAEEAGSLAVDKVADKVRPSLLTVINSGRDGYAQGLGTGFVISKDGLVVTNLHVVGEARPINVELQDGRRPKVTEVLGWSRKEDLIVFRIDVNDVPPLPMGPGAKMPQGTAVVAMGNPLGLRYSVVSGIVSETRQVDGQELIQLAMPIEKGNSGGPLVDSEGKLRGVINMKSAVTENLGYAIPVATLQAILANPAPVKIENWLTIGKLNPKTWKSTEASWTQRAGRIVVNGQGEAFGGRALCVYQPQPPELPYEVSVRVKLDDASGAGGLIFCSDGADSHYGFYPTAGKLRLTRFQGPDISQWTILQDVNSEHLKTGDWNHLRVRIEEKKILCYINGHEVIKSDDDRLRTGKVGLCKFRQTQPEFKDFRLGKNLGTAAGDKSSEALQKVIAEISQGKTKPESALSTLAKSPDTARDLIEEELRSMEKRAEELKRLSSRIHEEEMTALMRKLISKEKDTEINLAEAALIISKLDNPDLAIADYLTELDNMAQEIRATFTEEEKADPLKATNRLMRWLFAEHGFHGSQDDYYSKSNSYLNEVMDDREGLPVSLSVLVLELAGRLNLPLAGIPVPGHFVVQFRPEKDPESGPYFDPFDRGKQLTKEEAGLLAGNQPSGIATEEDEFAPATKREIILRMLRNLIGIQLDEKSDAALPYLNLLLTVSPEESSERLSRAIILFKSGQKREAKSDIQWLLDKQPQGVDLERLQEWLDTLPPS